MLGRRFNLLCQDHEILGHPTLTWPNPFIPSVSILYLAISCEKYYVWKGFWRYGEPRCHNLDDDAPPKDGKSKPAKMCPAPSHCCQLWSSGSFLGWSCIHMAMDQYLWKYHYYSGMNIQPNPSYFDVNIHKGYYWYWHTAICFPGEVLLCIHPPRWPAVSQMSWPPDLWNLWTLEGFTRPHPENSSWSSASGIAVMVSTCIYNTIIYHKSWKDLPFLIRPYFEDLLVSPRRWAKRMSAMAGAFGCETETLRRQGHHT